MPTTRREFVELLCQSDFGKIICINLYRSASIGALQKSSIAQLLTSAHAALVAESSGKGFTDAEMAEYALEIIRAPSTWEPLVVSSPFVCPSAQALRPDDLSTVMDATKLEKAIGMSDLDKSRSFLNRKVKSASELRVLIRVATANNVQFKFGSDHYFWISRPLSPPEPQEEAAAMSGDETSVDPWAQLHKDVLGLCHYGHKNRLLRALIPKSSQPPKPFLRPTAIDGIWSPVFLAARHDELNGQPASQPGTTRDLTCMTQLPPQYGVNEWLCASFETGVHKVTWEYLGSPGGDFAVYDETLHQVALKQLEAFTPIVNVQEFLSTLE